MVLAPVQKADQHTSVSCEQGKLDVIIRNSNIEKFDMLYERITKLSGYISRRGPRTVEKSTEA